ncbi:MAG: TIGR03936 family radical SAM-associated protein [Anaerolineales bacterium]
MLRLRIDFAKENPIRFIGHLDLFRTWERAFRRAQLPLSYTQGFKHHPRLNIASALPLGFTSSNEIMDVWLEKDIPCAVVQEQLQSSLPVGLNINSIKPVSLSEPALQVLLIGSDYRVIFLEEVEYLDQLITQLLKQVSIPLLRHEKLTDIRPLIFSLSLLPNDYNGNQRLNMRLSSSQDKNLRPDEVLKILGIDPALAIFHRYKLIFKNDQSE